jgi:hypothetical protein
MFVVVRNLKSANRNVQEYKLGKLDTIKLGRLKFSVKDYRTDTVPAIADKADMNDISPVKIQYEDDEEDVQEEEAVEIDCGVVNNFQEDGTPITCKICWGSDQSVENPLLNSCKCDGSVRYTHYECLKYWLI